jgi:hypothetical protein
MTKKEIVESMSDVFKEPRLIKYLLNKSKDYLETVKEAYDLGLDVSLVVNGADYKPLVNLAKKGYDAKPYAALVQMFFEKDTLKLMWALLENCLVKGLDTYIFTVVQYYKLTYFDYFFLVDQLEQGINYTHEEELLGCYANINVENYYEARNLGVSPTYAGKMYRFIPTKHHATLKEAQDVLGEEAVFNLLEYSYGCTELGKENPIFTLLKTLVKYNIPIDKVKDLVIEEPRCAKYITKCLTLTKGRLIPKTPMSYTDLLYDKYGEDFKDFMLYLDNYQDTANLNRYRMPFFCLMGTYHAYKLSGFEFTYEDVIDLFTYLEDTINFRTEDCYKTSLSLLATGNDVKFYSSLFSTEDEYHETRNTIIKANKRKLDKEFWYLGYAKLHDAYYSNRTILDSVKNFKKAYGF